MCCIHFACFNNPPPAPSSSDLKRTQMYQACKGNVWLPLLCSSKRRGRESDREARRSSTPSPLMAGEEEAGKWSRRRGEGLVGGGSKGGATNRLAAAPASSAVARVDPSPRLLWQPVTHAPAFTPPSLPASRLSPFPHPSARLARCHVLSAQSPAFQRFQSARRGASAAERHAGRPVGQTESERGGEEIDTIFFFSPQNVPSPCPHFARHKTGLTPVAAPPLASKHRWSDEGRGRGGGGESGLFVSSCAFQLPQKIFVSWPAGAPTGRHSLPARPRVRRPPPWSAHSSPSPPPQVFFLSLLLLAEVGVESGRVQGGGGVGGASLYIKSDPKYPASPG